MQIKQKKCGTISIEGMKMSVDEIERCHAPLVRFNRIGRENSRINNKNNGPSLENNRGG